MRKTALLFLLVSAWCGVVSAIFVVPEKPTSYVNDYANLLSTEGKQTLETTLKSFTASTTNEIAVVTVPSLDGDSIERYAVTLFTKWKIGTEKHDNGVLLLISRDDRKARIEVGYGLEGALPDVLASQILNDTLIPQFKEGHIDAGIIGAVDAIIKATQGEYTYTGKAATRFNFDMIAFFGIFGIQGLAFLSAIFARSKSWWAGGIVGALLGVAATVFHVFGLSLAIGLVITFFLTVFGLLFDFLVSNAYKSAVGNHSSVPWWAGGSSGGWRGSSSGGGSSFGGFSGGRSGGGGASGSW